MLGMAGSLLVFTGLWHAFEWLMGGRNRDTLRLIPFGVVYLLLGVLIVMFIGGVYVPVAALIVTVVGAGAAFAQRGTLMVRAWVLWAFIVIDIGVIAALVIALLG